MGLFNEGERLHQTEKFIKIKLQYFPDYFYSVHD